jgi:hypothetical protein
MRAKPLRAVRVPVTFPARRCCAPGCGDKIKDDEMFRIELSDGSTRFLEAGCVPWFVDGHPDVPGGGGFGPVEGLP